MHKYESIRVGFPDAIRCQDGDITYILYAQYSKDEETTYRTTKWTNENIYLVYDSFGL